MTSKKVLDFLTARDRALARGDYGVVRATTADLRRWGVSDDATYQDPSGVRGRVEDVTEPRKGGRPKLPRCEHGSVAERCQECNEELAAK